MIMKWSSNSKATNIEEQKIIFRELKPYLPNGMDTTGPPYPNIPKYSCMYTKKQHFTN